MYKILKQQKVTVVFFFLLHTSTLYNLFEAQHMASWICTFLLPVFSCFFLPVKCRHGISLNLRHSNNIFSLEFSQERRSSSPDVQSSESSRGRLRMPIDVFSNPSPPAMLATFSLVTARWMVYITKFVKLNSLSFWYHNSNHTDITSL